MLASSGPIRGRADDWAFEPKWDGWRCLLRITDTLSVRTRNGHDITARVPELASLAEGLDQELVLDGELVAVDGRPGSFYRLLPRMASGIASRERLTFVAFDVLFAGEDLTAQPYATRRARLEALDFSGPAWATTPAEVGLGPELFVACAELGLEGVVAKKLSSQYRQGARSRDWVKVKCPSWASEHRPLRQLAARGDHRWAHAKSS